MFYTFSQNNSGGSFVVDEDLTHFVIIEADSLNEACDKFKSLGGYFNGVEEGIDCPCCGDRWSHYADCSEKPEVYGEPPEDYRPIFEGLKSAVIIVHYKNGNKESF